MSQASRRVPSPAFRPQKTVSWPVCLAAAAPERQAASSRNASGRRAAAAGGLDRRRNAMVARSMCVEGGGMVLDVVSDEGVGSAGEVSI